jgi:hypothetical protein
MGLTKRDLVPAQMLGFLDQAEAFVAGCFGD